MALNTLKCNRLASLSLKGLNIVCRAQAVASSGFGAGGYEVETMIPIEIKFGAFQT